MAKSYPALHRDSVTFRMPAASLATVARSCWHRLTVLVEIPHLYADIARAEREIAALDLRRDWALRWPSEARVTDITDDLCHARARLGWMERRLRNLEGEL